MDLFSGEEEEVVIELTRVAFGFLQGRVYFNNNNTFSSFEIYIPGLNLHYIFLYSVEFDLPNFCLK